MSKVTLISHIYNEEYLLPSWLEHHKKMVDDIVIVDYNSTDRSLEICNRYNCKILQSKNKMFQADLIDEEIMKLEETIEGIKIVLNTTEFLFTTIPIKHLFINESSAFTITSYVPYSKQMYDINNYYVIMNNLLDDDVKFHNGTKGFHFKGNTDVNFRGHRSIHNYSNGNYHLGRHNTYHPSTHTDKLFIMWFGYFPLNEYLINRKLQIKNKMTENDKILCRGYQHLYMR